MSDVSHEGQSLQLRGVYCVLCFSILCIVFIYLRSFIVSAVHKWKHKQSTTYIQNRSTCNKHNHGRIRRCPCLTILLETLQGKCYLSFDASKQRHRKHKSKQRRQFLTCVLLTAEINTPIGCASFKFSSTSLQLQLLIARTRANLPADLIPLKGLQGS